MIFSCDSYLLTIENRTTSRKFFAEKITARAGEKQGFA
jgi:hypothetical protein